MDFINGLKEERASLAKRLDAIDVLLASYDTNSVHTPTNTSSAEDNSFPKGSSYIKQITYIIKRENRFLRNKEITEMIQQYHADKDIVFLKRRISSVLSKAKDEEGNLTNITVGNSKRNTFWGSKDWLDSNGKPVAAHMYDKSKLSLSKPRRIDI